MWYNAVGCRVRIKKQERAWQMEEKRKYKRLDIDVSILLERLGDDEATLRYADVAVTDVSKGGIGFKSDVLLEVGTYYDTRIQIWTKEIIDSVIKVVRRVDDGEGYHYGAIFVGMSDIDGLKIDIYQLFYD